MAQRPINPSAIIPRAGCDAAPSGKAAASRRERSPLCLPRARRRKTPWRRFGLDGHGLGHGPQDRHRQHRLASRRPGAGRPQDDCRTAAGKARILHRHRHHGALLRCDAGGLGEPQQKPPEPARHRRRDHPHRPARGRHRRGTPRPKRGQAHVDGPATMR